jgi:hypothetical protein
MTGREEEAAVAAEHGAVREAAVAADQGTARESADAAQRSGGTSPHHEVVGASTPREDSSRSSETPRPEGREEGTSVTEQATPGGLGGGCRCRRVAEYSAPRARGTMHGVGAAVGEHAAGMHRARRLLVRADELMMEKELRIRDSRIPAREARLPVTVGNSASASPMAPRWPLVRLRSDRRWKRWLLGSNFNLAISTLLE